jgi:hypothetical protein
MSERVQRQAEAERAVRRGELKQALAIYRELAREAPRTRSSPRASPPSSRCCSRRDLRRRPAPAAPTWSRSATLELAAEALFEQGDLRGRWRPTAAAAGPADNELARERLLELQHLAG